MPQTGQRTVAILCSNDAGPESGAAVETNQARIMANPLQTSETRQKASLVEARGAPNGGFKRLALPAVAAAVQQLSQARSQETAHQDRVRRDRKPS